MVSVGKDGQPYWSARDLAKTLGYTEWRNFAEAIRRARQQVANHVSAGSDPFVDTNKSVPNPSGGAARRVPDVHLTRFAAYFVALNADQSKPEVRAQVHLVWHYLPFATECPESLQVLSARRRRPVRGLRGGGRSAARTAEVSRADTGGRAGERAGDDRGTLRDSLRTHPRHADDTLELAPRHALDCEVRHTTAPGFDAQCHLMLRAVHARPHPAWHNPPRSEPRPPVLPSPNNTQSTPGPQCYPHWDAILRALLCHLVVTAVSRCRL